jgi:hypothetical protein
MGADDPTPVKTDGSSTDTSSAISMTTQPSPMRLNHFERATDMSKRTPILLLVTLLATAFLAPSMPVPSSDHHAGGTDRALFAPASAKLHSERVTPQLDRSAEEPTRGTRLPWIMDPHSPGG